ncbi:alpha/beta fold hydrolase [Roseibium salinum]|nr:alpha/beta fold hydrolase [Roseibium salinum]
MSEQTGIVLVHGAWHSGSTWSEVAPLLRDKGFDVVAVDLPGAGPNASRPASFSKRPLESAVFATEPSPNAGVGQEERTQAFIDAVRASSERTGKKRSSWPGIPSVASRSHRSWKPSQSLFMQSST